MKVGIITLQGNYNYGNRLQNYALQEVIREMGYEVETISINTEKGIKHSFIYDKVRMLKNIVSLNYLKNKKLEIQREKMKKLKEPLFIPFTQKYINNHYVDNDSDNELSKLNNRYDYIVIGSDQVWNPSFTSNKRYFFGSFVEPEKRISYAASFGISDLPRKYEEEYRKGLADIEHISVRESAGANIVKDLLNIDVDVVLDPTLLLSKKQWLELSGNSREVKEAYILIYFLSDDIKVYMDMINEFSKGKQLKIITIMGEFYDEDYLVATPKDFLNLINNAEYVFTDSFHAVVFSIIMETKFLAFQRGGMNSRIETLLHFCGLEKSFNDVTSIKIDPSIETMEFDNVTEILEKESKKSKQILLNYLSSKN